MPIIWICIWNKNFNWNKQKSMSKNNNQEKNKFNLTDSDEDIFGSQDFDLNFRETKYIGK